MPRSLISESAALTFVRHTSMAKMQGSFGHTLLRLMTMSAYAIKREDMPTEYTVNGITFRGAHLL